MGAQRSSRGHEEAHRQRQIRTGYPPVDLHVSPAENSLTTPTYRIKIPPPKRLRNPRRTRLPAPFTAIPAVRGRPLPAASRSWPRRLSAAHESPAESRSARSSAASSTCRPGHGQLQQDCIIAMCGLVVKADWVGRDHALQLTGRVGRAIIRVEYAANSWVGRVLWTYREPTAEGSLDLPYSARHGVTHEGWRYIRGARPRVVHEWWIGCSRQNDRLGSRSHKGDRSNRTVGPTNAEVL